MLTSLGLIALLKINIWVFVVKGENQIPYTYDQLGEMLQGVQRTYRKIGVEPSITAFQIPDYFPRWSTVLGQNYRYLKWKTFMWKNKITRPRRIVHIIFPPMCDQNGVCGYIGGLARQCGYRKRDGISISNGTVRNQNGLRLQHSRYAVNHETAHQLGADHVTDETVMNTNMLGFVDKYGENMNWNPVAIPQINECIYSAPAKTKHRLHVRRPTL